MLNNKLIKKCSARKPSSSKKENWAAAASIDSTSLGSVKVEYTCTGPLYALPFVNCDYVSVICLVYGTYYTYTYIILLNEINYKYINLYL